MPLEHNSTVVEEINKVFDGAAEWHTVWFPMKVAGRPSNSFSMSEAQA